MSCIVNLRKGDFTDFTEVIVGKDTEDLTTISVPFRPLGEIFIFVDVVSPLLLFEFRNVNGSKGVS